MKVRVSVSISQDWNNTPVGVDVAEETTAGDFTEEGAKVLARRVEQLVDEARGKALVQVEEQRGIARMKEQADARRLAEESVL